jgi:hypothetical protein
MSAVARTSCSRRRFSRDSARLSSSAFHRVVQRSPLRRCLPSNPLPHTEVCFGHPPPSVCRGPPSWFLTTLTDCSSSGLRACCVPLPTMRFTGFCALSNTPHRCHTLQSIPLPSSRPDVTARPLPPRRHGLHPARPRGLAPLESPLHLTPLPMCVPVALMGFPSWCHVHVASHLACIPRPEGPDTPARLANTLSASDHPAPSAQG